MYACMRICIHTCTHTHTHTQTHKYTHTLSHVHTPTTRGSCSSWKKPSNRESVCECVYVCVCVCVRMYISVCVWYKMWAFIEYVDRYVACKMWRAREIAAWDSNQVECLLTHISTHTHTHAYIHRHKQAHTYTHKHTHTQTHSQTHTHSHINTRSQTYTHVERTETNKMKDVDGLVGGALLAEETGTENLQTC
jgi:hypothetical protein